MPILKKVTCLVLLIFFEISFGQVNDSIPIANQLEEIKISAFHVNDSILNTPASVAILTNKDLMKGDGTDITAAMNSVAGVQMQSGALNTNRISIRGIGARTPYGTNKIRAFYGNIPLTSGDSETTIEDIDIENINQVEIIKGPLSSVYGAGLGGAILISPKIRESAGSNAYLSTTHGSYNLLKSSVGFNIDTKSASLNLSAHSLETDGWRENSAYRREGYTIAGELFRRPKSKLTYFGNYTYLKAYIPSSIDKNTFENNPRAAAATWNAAKGFEQYDSYLAGLSFENSWFGNVKNATSVFINHKESNEPRPFDILKQNTTAYGVRTQFSGSIDRKKNLTYLGGFELFRDNYSGSTFENLYQENNGQGSLQGNRLSDADQMRNFINVFAQLRARLSSVFEVQAGLNFNKTSFNLDNTFPENLENERYSYDAIWSPQISFLYKPSSLNVFYFSVSRGFSLPSIAETLDADGQINPNVKPESGYNFEFGAKWYLLKKSLFVEAALYRMEIRDLLVAQRIGDDQYVGVNAGKTLHQGIETTVRYSHNIGIGFIQPYAAFSIGEYKFVEFVNNGDDFSGNALTGVPKSSVNLGLDIKMDVGLFFLANFQFTDRLPMNDSNSDYNDSWNTLNLKAGWKLTLFNGCDISAAIGINNVTDTRYASMVLVNATGFGSASPRFYYPGMPVNYYGMIRADFRF